MVRFLMKQTLKLFFSESEHPQYILGLVGDVLAVCFFFWTPLASLSHVLHARSTKVLLLPMILSSWFVISRWWIYANLIELWKMAELLYFRCVIHKTGKPRKSIQAKHCPPGLRNMWNYSVNKIKNISFLFPDGSRIRTSTIYPRPGG